MINISDIPIYAQQMYGWIPTTTNSSNGIFNDPTKEEIIYRFKTESEFKKQFGENWRREVECSWTNAMDPYLGKEISKKIYDSILIANTKYKDDKYCEFNFSKNMVIKIIKLKENALGIESTTKFTGDIKGEFTMDWSIPLSETNITIKKKKVLLNYEE